MTNKLYSVIGITVLNGNAKVRYSNDTVRHVKKFMKYGATRINFVDLPKPMTKIEGLKLMSSFKEFQSDEDQSLISETLETKIREARKGEVKVVSKPSLQAISSRGRKANKAATTVGDVLQAVKS